MKFLLILFAIFATGSLPAEEMRFWMNAKINGQDVRLALDTGADKSVLFRGTVERLKLQTSNPPPGAQLPKGIMSAPATEPVGFSWLTITDRMQFGVLDMPPHANTQMDGFFSWAGFRTNIWIFDPVKGVNIGTNIPAEALSWPKFKLESRSGLLGFIVEDDYLQPLNVYIDTGAEHGLNLKPELWKKWLAAHPDQPATMIGYAIFPAAKIIKEEYWADSYALGSLTWSQLPVSEFTSPEESPTRMPNLAAVIGMAGLRRMDLVVDGQHGVAYVHPRTDVAAAYNHNLLGALFSPADDHSAPLLAHVARNSPAYRAGIRDGDQLLKIDDLDVTEWQTKPEIMPLGRFWHEKPPGTRYQLALKRGDKEYQVKVALERIVAPANQRLMPTVSPEELRAKAESGDAESQYNLATYYLTSLLGGRDEREAAKWYRKAAEQNHVFAQLHLGIACMMGAGVEKDPEAAVKWFRIAAEQGNAEAQFNLGYCYCKGQGVAKDAIDGMYWLRRAAEQNNSQAQLNLGVCYAMGDGTPKDLVEACKWMLLASWQGEEKAKVGVNKMTEVLSKEDFARAQTLAKEFKPRPFQPAKKDQ